MNQRICGGIKKNGQPCRTWAMLDSEFCFSHSGSSRARNIRNEANANRYKMAKMSVNEKLRILDNRCQKIMVEKEISVAVQTILTLRILREIDRLQRPQKPISA